MELYFTGLRTLHTPVGAQRSNHSSLRMLLYYLAIQRCFVQFLFARHLLGTGSGWFQINSLDFVEIKSGQLQGSCRIIFLCLFKENLKVKSHHNYNSIITLTELQPNVWYIHMVISHSNICCMNEVIFHSFHLISSMGKKCQICILPRVWPIWHAWSKAKRTECFWSSPEFFLLVFQIPLGQIPFPSPGSSFPREWCAIFLHLIIQPLIRPWTSIKTLWLVK